MNLKSFIIASLIIHVVGAVALYFYYNPINLSPKPMVEKEGLPAEELINKELKKAKALKPPANFKPETEKSAGGLKAKSQKKSSKPIPSSSKLSPKRPKIISAKKNPSKSSLKASQSPADLNSESSAELKLEESEKASTSLKAKNKNQGIKHGTKQGIKKEIKQEAEQGIKQRVKPRIQRVEQGGAEIKSAFKPKGDLEETKAHFLTKKPTEENFESQKSPAPQESSVENQARQKSPAPQESLVENNQAYPKSLGQGELKQEPENLPVSSSFHKLKQKIGNPPLSYPDFARRAGMEGTVSVLFFVTEQGLVDKIQLESSSGHKKLDNFVLQTLSRYEFLPHQKTWIRYKIPFSLKGEEEDPYWRREEKSSDKDNF